MLAERFPQLQGMHPGEIQLEELPELRNIVVIDNDGQSAAELSKLDIRSTVDWREVLEWKPSRSEVHRRDELEGSLNNDDVINLQFTSGTTGLPKAVSVSLDTIKR